MEEDPNTVPLDDEALDAVNGGGRITERTLLDPAPLVRLGGALSEMGSLLKNRFFGDHLVHYDD